MGTLMLTGHLCTYPGCEWTVVRPEPQTDYSDTRSLDDIHVAMERAMAATAEEVEAQIVHHLNTAHEGWTIAELQRNLDAYRRTTNIGVALDAVNDLRAALANVALPLTADMRFITALQPLSRHVDSIERYLLAIEEGNRHAAPTPR